MIAEIVMLLGGLYALIAGKVKLTKNLQLEGWRARVAGLFLAAPLPLALLTGLLIGILFGTDTSIQGIATLVELLFVLGGLDVAVTLAMITTPETQSPAPGGRQEQLATWLQFPRRIVLLLIAFGTAMVLIAALRGPLLGVLDVPPGLGQELDWSASLEVRRQVSELVGEQVPNTLLLLGVALLLALLLALVATLVAVLVHKLEEKTGPPGSILKGLGRLWVFSNAAMPVFCMAMCLIFIFAVRLELLPTGGMYSLQREPGGLGDRIKHLILPTLTLALFPAALTAQAVAREVTLPRGWGGARLWLTGLFKGLGTLLGQIGGLLSAMMLVETAFAWPGIGRLAVNAAMRHDYPVLLGVLGAYAGVILVGRLAAELFRWLERLVRVPILSPRSRPALWRRTARTIWVVVALVLLLIPLGLAAAGLAVGPGAALQPDLRARTAPPSDDHPWGTDVLGRDLRARVLRGGLITMNTVAFVAAAIFLPSILGGALIGFLTSRRTLWAESFADLLLLPADALLFIPAIPSAIVMAMLLHRMADPPQATWAPVGVVCAIVLLPRAVRIYQTLWVAAPEQHKGLTLGLAGQGALLLGSLFAGFGLVTALDFLGFGTQPPLPSLGNILGDAHLYVFSAPARMLSPSIVLWLCTLAFYTAADALVGFFCSKEALARLNE